MAKRKTRAERDREKFERRKNDPNYDVGSNRYKQPAEFTAQKPNYGDGDKVSRENRGDNRKLYVKPSENSSYSAIVNVYSLVNEAKVLDKSAYSEMKKQMDRHQIGKVEGAVPLSEIPQTGRTVVMPEDVSAVSVAPLQQYILDPEQKIIEHDGKLYIRAKTPTGKKYPWRPLIKDAKTGEIKLKRNASGQASLVNNKDVLKILNNKLESGQLHGGQISEANIPEQGTVGGTPISKEQAELNEMLGFGDVGSVEVTSAEPQKLNRMEELKKAAANALSKGKDTGLQSKPPTAESELQRVKSRTIGKLYPLAKNTINNINSFITPISQDEESIERILQSGKNLYYVANEDLGIMYIGMPVGDTRGEETIRSKFLAGGPKTNFTTLEAFKKYKDDMDERKNYVVQAKTIVEAKAQQAPKQLRRSTRCAEKSKSKFNRKSNMGIITGCNIPRLQKSENIFASRINKNIVLANSLPFMKIKTDGLYSIGKQKNLLKQSVMPKLNMPSLKIDDVFGGVKHLNLNMDNLTKNAKKKNKFTIKMPKINLKGF